MARLLTVALLTLLTLCGVIPSAQAAPAPVLPVANSAIWDYFQHRGGLRTVGQPVSQAFTLNGLTSQLFQRVLVQVDAKGNVQPHNLLDDLTAVQHVGGLTLPSPDAALIAAAPAVGTPDYAARMLDFLRQQVPDSFDGQPVNFLQTYLGSVPGAGDTGLQLLFGLEIWGVPTSRPTYDPANHGFIYQRFQRGVMHYQQAKQATEGLLVGDWFKQLLTGRDVPPDLAADAGKGPFFQQYDPGANHGPLRPQDMPGANLDGAFASGIAGNARFGVVVAGPGSDDPLYAASALQALHAGSWYSFGSSLVLPGRVQLVRPGAALGQLADGARANPHSAWLIGNEPNVPGQDDMTPGAYADFLQQVASAIKAADPSAQLVGPNVLNWDSTCGGCGGGLRASGHAWSDAFVAAYTQRYGHVPLDAWGIHAYTLDWGHTPMIDPAANLADLTAARGWLGAGPKLPLWLTEFGVIWAYEGLSQQPGGKFAPTGRYRDDLVAGYLDAMLGWLTAPGSGVDRWFLYATTPPAEPYATAPAGVRLLEPGSLTPTTAGQRYQSAALKAAS
ncbi:MAG TPA: glycosyl hydrolase [Chloroflexota bacterium]